MAIKRIIEWNTSDIQHGFIGMALLDTDFPITKTMDAQTKWV
ncbi:hypothetical protein [Coleofasciculus sp.]